MVLLSLKVRLPEVDATKTIQLNGSLLVYDACKVIREKFQESASVLSKASDYGLFQNDEDARKGRWLDPNRQLDFYLLRNGDFLDYRKKIRSLRVRMLDNSIKTLMIDESQTLKNLLPIICAKIGLTNYDEYDLVRDYGGEEKENGTLRSGASSNGTLKKSAGGTLSRMPADKDQKKMDKLRQELATDDNVSWVDQSKTLVQQGIDETDILLLKRRYFYSDQNIDARDPVQLNLLYVQTRDAIINGTHPVTAQQASQFAGLQAQAEYGSYDETRRTIDMRPFLPKYYIKNSPRVYEEWILHHGLSELPAKVEYIKLARSLKTYGVTFFLVKEKMKGKNKLVPRLFGVNRSSCMRLDERTKEILTTWPLTQVKRWAASPNTFSLDFGDYADEYYSVQTLEGEKMAQLIAGYIDIILKRQKPKDSFGITGEEGCTLEEEEVHPEKIRMILPQETKVEKIEMGKVAIPGIMRDIIAEKPIREIPPAKKQIAKIEEKLTGPAILPAMGEDPVAKQYVLKKVEMHKQSIGTQMAQITSNVAQIVHLTAPPVQERDHVAVDRAINTITENLDEMVDGIKNVAAHLDKPDQDELLDATRRLCKALRDLLDGAQPGEAPRQKVFDAATNVGKAVMEVINRVDPVNIDYQNMLDELAKNVATATSALVRQAKQVASSTDDVDSQNRIIAAATATALNTSELVTTARVLSPTIATPENQDLLVDAARRVAKSVQDLLDACKISSAPKVVLEDLNDAARRVTQALNDLLSQVKRGPDVTAAPVPYEASVQIIEESTRQLVAAPEPAEMIRQAKVLAQATAELVKGLKSEAEHVSDKDLQRRLLAASKQLADATTRLVEAAKLCAASPQDGGRRQAMRDAAQNINMLAQQTTEDDERITRLRGLETAARRVIHTGTQTINAAKGAKEYNKQPGTQQHLMDVARILTDRLTELITALKRTVSVGTQTDPAAAAQLVRSAEDTLSPGHEMVNAARTAVPTVDDHRAANRLRESSSEFNNALGDLRSSVNRMKEVQPATVDAGVDAAMTVIHTLSRDIEEFKRAANRGNLVPLPDDTDSTVAGNRLQQSAKQLSTATVQLLNASQQYDETSVSDASQNVARSLQDLTEAARGVAATSPDDRQSQQRMLDSVKEVVERSAFLVDNVRDAFGQPGEQHQSRLVDAARQVAEALDRCLKCLPDRTKGITNAIRTINEYTTTRLTTEVTIYPPGHGRSPPRAPGDVHMHLNDAASYLNEAAGEVASSTFGPAEQLGAAGDRYSDAYKKFVETTMTIVTTETERDRREEMVHGLKDLSAASQGLLQLAQQTHGQPHAPQMKNQLNAAARAVTESINNLLTYCASSLPTQKECDNAIRRIQMLRPLLDDCSQPVNQRSYYESLDAVLDSSRVLGDGMAGISNAARYNQSDQFIQAVRATSDAVSALIENAAQAGYLIGISDPSSTQGRDGVIDQRAVADAARGIHEAGKVFTGTAPATHQQMLSSTTEIAKYSHALCHQCRNAANRCANPVASRQFVQSAKDIAIQTANLVRAVKALESGGPPEQIDRQACVTHIHSLTRTVNELSAYSSSPEFASSGGQLSQDGRKAQEPIIVSGRCIIDASSSLIQGAKSLSVNSRDPAAWQALTSQSTNVSDAVKSLATSIRDRAPGQQECAEALDRLSSLLRVVDKASLEATRQTLNPRNTNTTEGFYDVTITTTSQLSQTVTSVREAAKSEAEALGHRVSHMSNFYHPLVQDAIGSASRTESSRDQMEILNQLKTVLEASIQFIDVSKACGGNPRTRNLHNDLNESADGLMEALRELTQTLERIQSESGFVRTMINNINTAISNVDQRMMHTDESFSDYQTRMLRTTKEITRLTHEINAKSSSDPHELGNLTQNLYGQYNQLAEDSRGAQGTAASDNISQRIRSSVQDLGRSTIDLIKTAGSVQGHPTDTYIKDELSRSSKLVIEKVSYVLQALQEGSRGTQACINAASTVSGVIGDLDTCIMFATAGTLQPENEGDRFQDHREDILKTAKALVEDTKTLVTGAASNQEQLAVAAQNAVKTIIQLADVVKGGAASLGKENSESQRQSLTVMTILAKRLEMEKREQKVLLINAVRDVASALGDLIHATKAASGKSLNDPAMTYLKDSAKIMVTNVTSLLKTVKTVEDEHARGTRALEATIEALAQEIRVFDSSEGDGRTATAEDVLRATRAVAPATYKAVAAGSSGKQDDAIIAANMGRKALSDLLYTCKAAAYSTESADVRNKLLSAGRDCALKFRELLHTVHMILTRPDGKNLVADLKPMTHSIVQAIHLITAAAENMKEASGWVNPEDPTVIAENELLGAAATIEHAARRLTELRPRNIEYKLENNESMNFDEMILQACLSITTATAALIKSASVAQAELVSDGKVSARPLYSSEDGQWSDGLITAARTVAAACHNLCEAANALVQGHATEEKLISSAKQVASSTAQLLVACRVKTDSNSPSMQRLQAAGNAVKRATDELVRAAQQSLDAYEERSLVINRRIVGGIAQEITAQEEVLIKERELEEARGKLSALRKAKYGERQSDDEYYGYGASPSNYASHTTTETRITEARYTTGSGYGSQ